jgi:hypothetical protein
MAYFSNIKVEVEKYHLYYEKGKNARGGKFKLKIKILQKFKKFEKSKILKIRFIIF